MTATLDTAPERDAVEPSVPRQRVLLLVVAGVVAALGILAAVPSAEVVVTAPMEAVERPVAVTTRAITLQAEASQRADVTTTGVTAALPATGKVRFSYDERTLPDLRSCLDDDAGCPSVEIAIPAGTRVGTCMGGPLTYDCGKLDVAFVTLAGIRMRLGAFSDLVPIRAVESGERGNVDIGAIRVVVLPSLHPNAELTLYNPSDITGGADERRGLVGQADVDRVVAAEGPRLRAEAERKLRRAAGGKGLAPAVDLRVEVRAEARPAVGSPSLTAEVTVTAVATASGYAEDDLRDAATEALEAARPPERFLVPDSVEWSPPTVEGERVTTTARARVSPVDTESLPRSLRGRRPGSAESDLEERYGPGTVTVRRRPFPLPVLPLFASRIHVDVRPE